MVGASAIFDFPSHRWHGKRVEIVGIDPAFPLDSAGGRTAEIVFVRGPGIAEPIGVGRAHLSVSEAEPRRAPRAPSPPKRQGTLAL